MQPVLKSFTDLNSVILRLVIFLCVTAAVVLSCNYSFCAEADTYHVEFQGIKNNNLLDQIQRDWLV